MVIKYPIPFIGAIIKRENSGEKEVVVQTRIVNKNNSDSKNIKYNNTLEIPGGKVEAGEDILETIKREVKEECGLTVTKIIDGKIESYINKEDNSEIFYPFCVTQMKEGPFLGFIFRCEASGELLKKGDLTIQPKWIKVSELKKIVEETPEKIYTPFLGPLKKYLESE